MMLPANNDVAWVYNVVYCYRGKHRKLAVIRPIDLWKDHTQTDQINAIPKDTPKSEILPMNLMLLGKAK